MKIKNKDTVLIIHGNDRGRSGKVIRSFPKEGRILVQGINLQKKHRRPKKEGEKGQIVEMPGFVQVNNVKLVCPKCGKATRVSYKILPNKKKVRICKKCGEAI